MPATYIICTAWRGIVGEPVVTADRKKAVQQALAVHRESSEADSVALYAAHGEGPFEGPQHVEEILFLSLCEACCEHEAAGRQWNNRGELVRTCLLCAAPGQELQPLDDDTLPYSQEPR